MTALEAVEETVRRPGLAELDDPKNDPISLLNGGDGMLMEFGLDGVVHLLEVGYQARAGRMPAKALLGE